MSLKWDIHTSTLAIFVFKVIGSEPDISDPYLYEFQACTHGGWAEYNPAHAVYHKPIANFEDRYDVLKEIKARALKAGAKTIPDIG